MHLSFCSYGIPELKGESASELLPLNVEFVSQPMSQKYVFVFTASTTAVALYEVTAAMVTSLTSSIPSTIGLFFNVGGGLLVVDAAG